MPEGGGADGTSAGDEIASLKAALQKEALVDSASRDIISRSCSREDGYGSQEEDNALPPPDNVSRVKKTLFMPDLRMKASKVAFLRVNNAGALFATGRKPEGHMTTGFVSVGDERSIPVSDVNFKENKIEVLVAGIQGEEILKGSVVVNEGAAPRWKWLRGKGGYDNEYDVWCIRHDDSLLMLELGYGCVRMRTRPGSKVQFIAFNGRTLNDSGMTWNKKDDGTYHESWLSPQTAMLCSAVDTYHPFGMGQPFPHIARFGVWEVEVSEKTRMIMLRNLNVTYEVEQGLGKEVVKRPITILLNAAGHMLFISQANTCVSIGSTGKVKFLDKTAASELARRFWKEK